jgi:hypothetical protein
LRCAGTRLPLYWWRAFSSWSMFQLQGHFRSQRPECLCILVRLSVATAVITAGHDSVSRCVGARCRTGAPLRNWREAKTGARARLMLVGAAPAVCPPLYSPTAKMIPVTGQALSPWCQPLSSLLPRSLFRNRCGFNLAGCRSLFRSPPLLQSRDNCGLTGCTELPLGLGGCGFGLR